MKKPFNKIVLALALTANLAAFVSCREKNTGEQHYNESKSVEDDPVETPSARPQSDSTPTGTDNSMPAQSSDTVGNNQGSVSPAPSRP